ncbi:MULTISPECIES: hypothetical protein [unclassified Neochlamydia]|uniref:hypothetical protein n=1 Tax=unclassified Neochlamydia TaxID=2643326 RepID=UPI00140A6351|nr:MULTISPECIES: hypothetical protein [unclassified Neochlamydia]MBS4167165.1 hypothetical protein [Neochlamydia sp. AcF65]MBS4169482.1 hypothetical protein [Neochlamydia sp. AcF95]NGY95234.1 hypothetical protein [Neochlamydia sp. AcF84]
MNITTHLSGMSHSELVSLATQLAREKEKIEQENRKLEEENAKLKRAKVCNLLGGDDLSSISNSHLSALVIARLPEFTYEGVSVTRVGYTFYGDNKASQARKIELIRTNTSIISHSLSAFFSSLFKSNSVYRKVLDHTSIQQYLLASDELATDAITEKKCQHEIQTAYIQYKTIYIIVPENLEKDAEIHIDTGSKLVQVGIDSGKVMRQFFISKD